MYNMRQHLGGVPVLAAAYETCTSSHAVYAWVLQATQPRNVPG